MRQISEIEDDIVKVKKEKEVIKKQYGKNSVEYAEILEELDELKDELEFSVLHAE